MDLKQKLYIETLIHELKLMARTVAVKNALFKVKSIIDFSKKDNNGLVLLEKELSEKELNVLISIKVVTLEGGCYYLKADAYDRTMEQYKEKFPKKRVRDDWESDLPYERDPMNKKLKICAGIVSHAYHRYPITDDTKKAMAKMDKYMKHFKEEFGVDPDNDVPTIGINPAIIESSDLNELVRINIVKNKEDGYVVNWWNYIITSDLYQQRRDYIRHSKQLVKEEPERFKTATDKGHVGKFFYIHGLCDDCEFFPCICH